MKKVLLALIILSGLALGGCKSASGDDPKAVLSDFLEALSKKDIAKARTYATADSKQMLDLMEMGMKMSPDTTTDPKFDKSKLELGEPKIEGDKATIAVKEKASGEDSNFTLKKEDGKWKVAFDKASMVGPNMDKINEARDEMNNMNDSMPSMDSIMNSPMMDSIKKANQ